MTVKYKYSRCVNFQVPDRDKAVRLYHDLMGLNIVSTDERFVELDASPIRMFVEQGPFLAPIMEIIVNSLEAARDELVKHGCTVVRWEGAGKPCYLRDPFGVHFNLWEDPKEFE